MCYNSREVSHAKITIGFRSPNLAQCLPIRRPKTKDGESSEIMNKLSETEYRYDVIIDNPRVAMYDIEVLVIVNDKSLQISKEVMPSVGIFESGEYNLVPYQINLKSGYSKGFGLSGTVKTATVELKALVLWYDYAKVSQQREYFDLNAQYSEEIPG
jgi:hypothetical protein